MEDKSRPIGVVMFGSGPVLNQDARMFLARLEDHPEIELLGAFCQAESQSFGAVIADLWHRRGVLALPLLLARGWENASRFLFHPGKELRLKRSLAKLAGRIKFVPDIHALEVLDEVRVLAPDLGLVYGSPILKPPLFEIPALGTLGIHHGKVPAYRGNKTAFWAMFNGEAAAGVTIQKINAGLDTGQIVREGEVMIGRKTYGKVWQELETLGLELYLRAILDVKNGLAELRPQTGPKGRLYKNPKPSDYVKFWARWLTRVVWKRLPEMPPLKICIFTETYYPVIGGGETQAQLLAEGAIRHGHGAMLLTRRSDPSLEKIERYGDVTVYRLPPVGQGQLKKWGLLFSGIPALICLRRKYDLVFVSGFRIVGLGAVLVCKIFGKTCILKADSQGEMSGSFFDNGLSRQGVSSSFFPFRLFLSFRNWILRKADAFGAITEAIVGELKETGVDPDKIHRIPNCVDTNRFFRVENADKLQLRAQLGLPQNGRIAIYTGRLVSYKGLPLLVRVWKELAQMLGDIQLLLVGTGGLDIHNCEDELKTFVRENGLEACIRFTGSVRNVPEYLQASDVFVFPSEDDAFPSAMIEAMACGLPVIATPVGAIGAVIEDQKNGFLIPPGDFDALFRALQTVLSNDGLANRFAQAGWQTVQENYSADIVTQKYITLFEKEIGPPQTK